MFFLLLLTSVQSTSDTLNSLLENYDRNISPQTSKNSSSAQTLSFKLQIQNIFGFIQDERHFDLTLGYFLQWQDSRLTFNSTSSISLTDQQTEKIWRPQLRVDNMLETTAIVQSKCTLYSNGTIKYQKYLTALLGCDYDFKSVPFDTHKCWIQFTFDDSYLLQISNLQSGTSKGMLMSDSIYLPAWEILDHYILIQTREILDHQYLGVDGVVQVQRRQAYNIYFVILPSFFIIALAYASFWIDYRAAPSRTTLGTITILTSITQLYKTFKDYPKIGYNTWLLQFMYINVFFSIIAILEYVVVNRLWIWEQKKKTLAKAMKKLRNVSIQQIIVSTSPRVEQDAVKQNQQVKKQRKFKQKMKNIFRSPPELCDFSFRIGYAIVYISVMLNLFLNK